MKRILSVSLLIAVLALTMIATVQAQGGGGYDLTWNTIDNGGGESNGGGYTLAGTLGQPDANEALTGGGFTLTGGFWLSEDSQRRIYLPLVIRS